MPEVSIHNLPPTGLTMKEALAYIDCLSPAACSRYEWNKLRFFLSRLSGTKHFPAFVDTPLRPMIRGRAVQPNLPGKYDKTPAGRLLENTSEMGPLVPEYVKTYGRCHVPGSPIFYAAFDEATVLSEIKPEINSLVYFMTCVPKPDKQFHSCVVGEIDYIRRHDKASVFSGNNQTMNEIKEWLKNIKTEDHYVRIVTDAFLGSLMSRICANADDYKATSALCGLLMNLHEVDMPGSAEAIYYPSVAYDGGVNIALTRDCYLEKVTPISCKVVQVLNSFGYGIYKTNTIAVSDSIAADGKITWRGLDTLPMHLIKL
jgi:hypothetical protein